MADQKELKKRLKVLMQKPENQVCSDCPERQPRWASLIVPPPGSPPGCTATGAFCCLECSGSHRRLGVHISFVRSINLDSWKEKEVLAMENGGNKKVNAIWEANLARAGGIKPTTGADLNTRERYIRDKYERRKFFDPQALANYQHNEPSIDELVPQGGADFADFGPPPDAQISDAAKLRAEKKKKKAPTRNRSFDAPARTKSSEKPRRPKKQEPEPQPVADLLDFGSDPSPASASSPFDSGAAPFADFLSPDAQNGAMPTDVKPLKGSRSRSKSRGEMRTKSKTPDREKTRKNQQQDILNMYNNPMSGMGAAGMAPNNMAAAPNQANMMAMMQQQMQQMNMNPQQQQGGFGMAAPGSGPNPSGGGGGGGKHNSRLQVHQNLMMQQMQSQMQQQQRNIQQMQQMMQQNPQLMQQMMQQMQQAGGMNPQMMQQMMHGQGGGNGGPGGMNPQMMGMNPMMTGMSPNNTNMGMNPQMMGMNPSMMQQQPPQQFNAFGTMPAQNGQASASNANKAPEKEDPFAQFGMNAFR